MRFSIPTYILIAEQNIEYFETDSNVQIFPRFHEDGSLYKNRFLYKYFDSNIVIVTKQCDNMYINHKTSAAKYLF